MISKRSVVFKLSAKFALILTAAMLLLMLLFFLLQTHSLRKMEKNGIKNTTQNVLEAAESGDAAVIEKKLSELPYFISYLIYDPETNEIFYKRNEKLSILPLSNEKPSHYTSKRWGNTSGMELLYMTAKYTTPDGKSLVLQIAQNSRNEMGRRYTLRMLHFLAISSLPALLISFLFSLFISKRTMKPVVEITEAAKSISSQKLDQRLPETGLDDELDNLAQTFNQLFSSLKKDFEQERSFTSNVSHELKTPVAVILGQANLLRRWGKDDPAQLEKSINIILQETHSMEAIITNLLQLSRLENGKITPEKSDTDINQLFVRLKEEFSSVNKDMKINFEEKSLKPVFTDVELLHQVFVAVISNSSKFIKENPSIELNCTQTQSETQITILDNGPGFSAEVLPHVFERFFRGDESHNRAAGGSGLGLSIAQAIIHSLNGTITAANGTNGGALLTITLRS